jgi:hypothetical protein
MRTGRLPRINYFAPPDRPPFAWRGPPAGRRGGEAPLLDRRRVARYHPTMGVLPTFDSFVTEVRERLWVLEVEPAFAWAPDKARFMWPPYVAELEPLSPDVVRLGLSSEGELIRTIELPMDQSSAQIAADGIIAVFEPDPRS